MVGLTFNDKYPYTSKRKEEEKYAEDRVIWRFRRDWSNASGSQRLPRILPQSLQKEPILTAPWLWTYSVQSCEGIHSVVSCHQNCGNLLQQLQETNTYRGRDSESPPFRTGATCRQPIQPPRSHARLRQTCPLPGNICLPIWNVLGNVQESFIELQLNSLESMRLEKITSPHLKI